MKKNEAIISIRNLKQSYNKKTWYSRALTWISIRVRSSVISAPMARVKPQR